MSDELVTVRRYLWPHEAQIARSLLESEGLDAFVQDAHLAQIDWMYIQAIGGLRLQVRASDAERATAILDTLAEVDATIVGDPDGDACPLCGSRDSEVEVSGRRAAFLGLLAGIPFWRPRSTWRCASCKRPLDDASR